MTVAIYILVILFCISVLKLIGIYDNVDKAMMGFLLENKIPRGQEIGAFRLYLIGWWLTSLGGFVVSLILIWMVYFK